MVRTRQLTPGAPRDDAQVDSLRRGLEVLRLFDLRHRKLSLADIARKLDLSRPTTEKLVQTLLSHHFLQATGNDSYEPHAACLALGRAARKAWPRARLRARSCESCRSASASTSP